MNLNEGVQACIDSGRTGQKKRGLTISTQVEGGTISTDPTLWMAILNNLLGNTVSYAQLARRYWWKLLRTIWRCTTKCETLTRKTFPTCSSDSGENRIHVQKKDTPGWACRSWPPAVNRWAEHAAPPWKTIAWPLRFDGILRLRNRLV